MALIYCVEDDESIRELVGYALHGQGYKAVSYTHLDFYGPNKK